MVWVIVPAVSAAFELLYWLLHFQKKKQKKNRIKKSLYKLMEQNVLGRTLRERISSEQAALEETQKLFLYVEFPDTKPLLGYVYSLDECVTIGRSRENKICIYDELLSRMHCKIRLQDGNLILQDMGTANGTGIRRGLFRKVNLRPGEQALLFSGNMIRLGGWKIRICTYYGWEAHL